MFSPKTEADCNSRTTWDNYSANPCDSPTFCISLLHAKMANDEFSQ